MVTGAVFADFNGDKKEDLVLCGEWMPVRFFQNSGGKFTEVTDQTNLKKMSGQWRSLGAADMDNDGDLDFIAGNLGLNNHFNITPSRPLELYAGDFDANNSTDLIPAYYIKDNDGDFKLFPALDRAQLADQLPFIKKKFLLSSDYSNTSMEALLKGLPAKEVMEKKCETTTSVWIENRGDGTFVQHALPLQAQIAPINTIVASDMDNDGNADLLIAGNEYGTEFMTGRYDASYGLFLKGNGKGAFRAVAPVQSGFILDGDVKSLKIAQLKNGGKLVLAAVNDSPVKCFKLKTNRSNLIAK